MSPANAETASVKLRTVAAHTWRKVFIFVAPRVSYKNLAANKKFVITLEQRGSCCKSDSEKVRFARGSLLFLAYVKTVLTMTLIASLLHELENSSLSIDRRAELCCEAAKAFEYQGEYEKARRVLGDYWQRIGEHPRLEDLERNTAGEVLLRAGVLTGIIGSKAQIADSQETAKNLITESLRVFQSSHYRKKIAEAQTELALCYWRVGELNNARDLLTDALSALTTPNDVKAKAVVRLAIVEAQAASDTKALRILTENESLFEKINNETLKGSYHVTLGTVQSHLWESKQRSDYLDRALIEYAASAYHFERAGHKCYLANVENQLGLIYFKVNRCEEAHQHLDRAKRIHASLKDAGTVAQVDETRATVFLKQAGLQKQKQQRERQYMGTRRQEGTCF